MTHERKVEKLYSHGSKKRATQEGGFLSFGYWHNDKMEYCDAVECLLDRVLQFEQKKEAGKILNVACGYGAETFKIYEKIRPAQIVAIDITQAHIDHAGQQAKKLNLHEKIDFRKMDACKALYQANSFDYIIGIEGPAHFNTREAFLKNAFQMLKDKGILLLSDIMVNKNEFRRNWYNRIVGKLCSRFWLMPRANWISTSDLIELLEKIGYKVDHAESAGHKVFPGFASFNLKTKSIKNAILTRGIFAGLGITAISWMLGHVYKRNLIDYVLIRAVKIA